MTELDSTSAQTTRPAHLTPAGQPNHVRDLAGRLLDAYQVEGGGAHLAGCTLDEIPVVRLTWATAEQELEGAYVIFGQANSDGRMVDAELFEKLHLADVVPAERPVSVSPSEVDRLVEAAIRCAGGSVDDKRGEPDSIAVIWCKYARVKVQLSIGNATADVTFAGWARTLEPQPYACPITETKSFSVAATTDGRIVPADQLEVCQQSGRKVPRCELVQCAATGKLVAQDLTARCPVSGKVVVEAELVVCPTCGQKVSPHALSGNRCAACSRTSTVKTTDPRMAKIIARYPRLANWTWLRLAETDEVFIVIAAGLLDQRLLVVDKTTLDVRRFARGSRLSPTWTDEPEENLESL
jgi:hypothetical protein